MCNINRYMISFQSPIFIKKKSDNDMNFIFIEGTNIFHSLEAARILSRLDFDSLGH